MNNEQTTKFVKASQMIANRANQLHEVYAMISAISDDNDRLAILTFDPDSLQKVRADLLKLANDGNDSIVCPNCCARVLDNFIYVTQYLDDVYTELAYRYFELWDELDKFISGEPSPLTTEIIHNFSLQVIENDLHSFTYLLSGYPLALGDTNHSIPCEPVEILLTQVQTLVASRSAAFEELEALSDDDYPDHLLFEFVMN